MKHIANIISLSRIGLSLVMILVIDNVPIFIVIYVLCGVSDIMDGFIARKTNTQSIAGAKLDSAADFMMFGIITFVMGTWLGEKLMIFLPTIVFIVFVRVFNLSVGVWKYHTFVSIHTWGNKVAGLCVFLMPIFFAISQNTIIVFLTCLVAVLSALEESMIIIRGVHLDVNRRSFFF